MKKQNTAEVKSTEMQEAREIAEMFGRLSEDEKKQVKGIMIGLRMGREMAREAATA